MEKVAQFTLRGETAHIQYGVAGDYEKIDFPADGNAVNAFAAAKAAGVTRNSLYGSDTQYAPLIVREIKQRTFTFVPPPVVTSEVIVYLDQP